VIVRVTLAACWVMALLCAITALLVVAAARSGASTPTVAMSAASDLHSGQTITVTVGANSVFSPHAKVNILECADPGGTVANLPKDDSTCDGNTIQGDTVVVASNGSVSEPSYTVYALPNSILGEGSNFQPVCNATNWCVLYVGQSQNDFTAPKLFSQPFTVASAVTGISTATPSPATSTTTTPTTASSPDGQSLGHAATDASANAPTAAAVGLSQLPNTGLPGEVPVLVSVGTFFALIGTLGRGMVKRYA
jgi:hypothetical protein